MFHIVKILFLSLCHLLGDAYYLPLVLEVSPTKSASLLDVERLRARAGSRTQLLKKELRVIQESFKSILKKKNMQIPDLKVDRGRQVDQQGLKTGRIPALKDVPAHEILQALKSRFNREAGLSNYNRGVDKNLTLLERGSQLKQKRPAQPAAKVLPAQPLRSQPPVLPGVFTEGPV